MSEAKPTMTMTRENGQGYIVRTEVNLIADATDVMGLAGYPWVILAANPHLSSEKIDAFLRAIGGGSVRSLSWIKRHRWMFRKRDAKYTGGAKADQDGNYRRAVAIMHDNPTVSTRALVHTLKAHRIQRSREWVRQHRCDPME